MTGARPPPPSPPRSFLKMKEEEKRTAQICRDRQKRLGGRNVRRPSRAQPTCETEEGVVDRRDGVLLVDLSDRSKDWRDVEGEATARERKQ